MAALALLCFGIRRTIVQTDGKDRWALGGR